MTAMGAKKNEKFEVQVLSLDAIRVDHSIQSRVITDVVYQREFSEAMLRGDVFPPVVVFFDGKVYWLADGFHRHAATKKAGMLSIRAEIHYGTKRDAMIHSAGANIKFSIPRKPEDIRKAAEMLFADEEWGKKATSMIANKIGCRHATIRNHRNEWHERTGIPLVSYVECKDGQKRGIAYTSGNKTPPRILEYRRKGLTQYRTYIDGKRYWLGTNKEVAEANLSNVISKHVESTTSRNCEPKDRNWLFRDSSSFGDWLSSKGVTSKPCGLDWFLYPGVHGLLVKDAIITTAAFRDKKSEILLSAIGRIEVLAVIFSGHLRRVVLCEPELGPPKIIECLTRRGYEFLTPEDFVASLKGEPETEGTE
jgi:hypothetical protein